MTQPAAADNKVAHQLDELTTAVNELKDEVHVLRQVMDEIRSDLEYAVRNLGQHQNAWTAQRMPRNSLTKNSAEPDESADAKPQTSPTSAAVPVSPAANHEPVETTRATIAATRTRPRQLGKKKGPPLYERLHYKDHYVEIVRLVGYGGFSLPDARNALKPLSEKYGQQTVMNATDEILILDTSQDPHLFRLTDEARNLAWPILGPVPAVPAPPSP